MKTIISFPAGTSMSAIKGSNIVSSGVVLPLNRILSIADDHTFVVNPLYTDLYLTISLEINSCDIANSSIITLDKEDPIFINPVNVSALKLQKGKMYSIPSEYAKNLNCIPKQDIYRTPNGADNGLLPNFPYYPFEDTNFQNISGTVPCLQFDVDAVAYAKKQAMDSNKENYRSIQAQRNF